MNDSEVTKEILTDYEKLDSTVQNKTKQYFSLRRKHRIKKSAVYPRFASVKSKRKNNWLIMFSKGPGSSKLNATTLNILYAVYYYNNRGLRVFKTGPGQNGFGVARLNVYNGHFFSRFNERLSLGLTDSASIIKRFFKYNGYGVYQFTNSQKEGFMQFVKEGIALGRQVETHKVPWLINNTFISKKEIKMNQSREKESANDNFYNIVDKAFEHPSSLTKLQIDDIYNGIYNLG